MIFFLIIFYVYSISVVVDFSDFYRDEIIADFNDNVDFWESSSGGLMDLSITDVVTFYTGDSDCYSGCITDVFDGLYEIIEDDCDAVQSVWDDEYIACEWDDIYYIFDDFVTDAIHPNDAQDYIELQVDWEGVLSEVYDATVFYDWFECDWDGFDWDICWYYVEEICVTYDADQALTTGWELYPCVPDYEDTWNTNYYEDDCMRESEVADTFSIDLTIRHPEDPYNDFYYYYQYWSLGIQTQISILLSLIIFALLF